MYSFPSPFFYYLVSLLSASWHTPTLTPLHIFISKILLLSFFFFSSQHLSHVAPPLFHFSHEHNHILVTQLPITTHAFPAQHRSSNPKQHFPLLLPSLPWEKIATVLEDSLSLEEINHEKASDTSRTHQRCQAEALPKLSRIQLSATLSFRWGAPWHLTSFQLQLFIRSAFCFKEK